MSTCRALVLFDRFWAHVLRMTGNGRLCCSGFCLKRFLDLLSMPQRQFRIPLPWPKQSVKITRQKSCMLLAHQFIPISDAVYLEVVFYQNFNLWKHISQVSSCCFCHIHDLRHSRWHLNPDDAKSLACALVLNQWAWLLQMSSAECGWKGPWKVAVSLE